jgi:hypothetical protein
MTPFESQVAKLKSLSLNTIESFIKAKKKNQKNLNYDFILNNFFKLKKKKKKTNKFIIIL